MYVCYVCHHSIHQCDFSAISRHLSDHLLFGELKYPIHCQQEYCCSCFKTISNFLRHYKMYHAATVPKSYNMSAEHAECDTDESDSEIDINVELSSAMNNCDTVVPTLPLKEIQNEALKLCCMLKSNSAVPYSIVPEVMSSCNGMLNNVIDYVTQYLQSSAVKDIDDVHKFCESLKELQNPIDFLLTQRKQVNAVTSNPLFVQPESLITGLPDFELVAKKGRIQNTSVYKECQYVSLISNLQSIFANKDFFDAFDKSSTALVCDVDVVTNEVQSTKRYLNHTFFQQPNTVLLQLFYDDMGTTNALRGASAYHNVGVFYYTIRNLPAYFNSAFPNVHLLALCHSLDIRQYGFSIVLERFMQEVHTLETSGIAIEVNGGVSRQLFGTLYQVTCDNLGLNALFGLTKAFKCDYFCVHCYATQSDIQMFFREDQFVMRDRLSYDEDCKAAVQSHCTVRGVTSECLLNKSCYFHVMDNKTNDSMHTLLEGIVPFEIGCILHKLTCEKQFSLDWLNEKLAAVYNLLTIERRNRPHEIVSVQCKGKGISPAMKAVQMWSLIRILPLALMQLPVQKHPGFLLLLHLCHLTNLVFSPSFSSGMLVYLADVIADHLSMFKNLFPDIPLKPKHHFLVHYPTIIRLNGPTMVYSCLRYELKNSFFKRSSHIVCNFRNITLTLATRHQYNSFYDRLCGKMCRDFLFINHCENIFVHSLHGSRALCHSLNCTPDDMLVVSQSVSYRGKNLKRHCIIVVRDDTGCYLLQIAYFVRSEPQWKIIGRKADISAFLGGSCIAEVSFTLPVVYRVVAFEDIYDCEPLDLISIDEKSFVCFKWTVLGLLEVSSN